MNLAYSLFLTAQGTRGIRDWDRRMRGLFTDQIFVGIMVIGLLGLGTNQAFKYLHRWLLPWSPKVG